jgi:hypothetical protein
MGGGHEQDIFLSLFRWYHFFFFCMKVKIKKDKQSADSPLLEQRRLAAGESGRRGKIPTTFSLLFEMLKVQNTVSLC